MSEEKLANREWTFSQREGKVDPPEVSQLEELTFKFRQEVWKVIEESMPKRHDDFEDTWENVYNLWEHLYREYHLNVSNKFHDEIFYFADDCYSEFRQIILHGEYHEVLTLLEYVLRTLRNVETIQKENDHNAKRFSQKRNELSNNIKQVIDDNSLYFVDDAESCLCIMPSLSKSQKKGLKRCLETIQENNMENTNEHLCESVNQMNNSDYPGSVRESIFAVEAVAKTIGKKPNIEFSDALKKLLNEKIIHKALCKSLGNIYGYASDLPGARHSKKEDGIPVDKEDAMFMFLTCTAAAAYLVHKKKRYDEKTKNLE